MNTEPALMSLTSVAKAIAEKRVSSREATQSCLDRIAQWQPHLNAFMKIEAEEVLAAGGVTGFTTPYGPIRRAGGMPLSQSLETVGPLARTVEDCALLLALMAGADAEDPPAVAGPVPDYMAAAREPIKGLTIGVPSAFYVDDLDPEVARILDETVAALKREGADIVQVELPDQRQLTASCQLVLAVEAAAFHKRWLIERPQDYGPQVLMRLQNGLAIPGVTYLEAMRWRGSALSAHLAAVAGVDPLIG